MIGETHTGRRDFLKSMGGLTIAFSLSGAGCFASPENDQLLNDLPDDSQINAWIQLLENGRIRVITGKMELGQGIKTAIRQVAAEELTLPFDSTVIQIADTGETPNEGYTAGSRSIESSAMQVRKAAATAREYLIELAAEKWKVPAAEIEMKGGRVVSGSYQNSIGELLQGKQITRKLNGSAEIYGKTRRQVVGHPVRRDDIARMVTGEMTYVQDLRFDGMVHARVVRPPAYSSVLEKIDLAGLEDDYHVIRDGSFVGVIAEDEWKAIQGISKLQDRITWRETTGLPATAGLKDHLLSLETDSQQDEQEGDPATAIPEASAQLEATYFKPYIMHASNGPSCAVALYSDRQLTVWSHSQGVYPLRDSIATMMGMSADDIRVIGVPGSGCYGHNAADDVAAEAALIAYNYPDRHVRLQWMREDEHLWEPYGTAMIMKLKAGLNAQGRITGWIYDLWSDGHSTRPRGDAGSLLPARYLENASPWPSGGFRGGATRNARPYYETGALSLSSHIFSGPLRFSALRGLGAYANVFAIECYMDELAVKADIDPFQFRLMHLTDPRARDCLTELRAMIRNISPEEGQGIGIAFSRYKNAASYCAVAALVDGSKQDRPVVRRMWAVVDSGEVINPDGLKNQIEGGMIQSASWALMEEVKFDNQHVTSHDWNSYPVLRYQEVPLTEVRVIDRPDQPPLGAGEAAQGPATAAVVNAYYAATGTRVRDLPIIKQQAG